ncbi:hypothetical protein K439DRAFT_191699 [Ramaria rubella]|nr:hypothetical protein K439DRAFT_191699 [Ramaria rubella]
MQFWEAKRLRELPPDLLTPMYQKGLKYYYVNEICQLESGELVIPYMWIIQNKKMCVNGYKVLKTPEGLVVLRDLINIPGELHDLVTGCKFFVDHCVLSQRLSNRIYTTDGNLKDRVS